MENEISVKIISQKDLMESGCFDVSEAIKIIEDAFLEYLEGRVIFPDKVSTIFEEKSQNRINCLPAAVLKKHVYGMKWVSVFPENPLKYNAQNLSAVILLSELKKGFPIAFMEGTLCSNLRTAAVGAVAAKYLARKNIKTIGFIGAGEQAKSHFLAMMEIRPNIEKCKVASRTNKSEKNFIKQMKKFYPNIEFVECNGDYKEAAEKSDIIVTAISGQEPIFKAEWVDEGTFYCHVAGLEDEYAVAERADKIVVDDWEVVKHRTQTISRMYNEKLLRDEDIYANLSEIISGNKLGRENDKEFIYFNSVGLSFLDIALSNWMYEKVVEQKKGMDILIQENSMFDMEEFFIRK